MCQLCKIWLSEVHNYEVWGKAQNRLISTKPSANKFTIESELSQNEMKKEKRRFRKKGFGQMSNGFYQRIEGSKDKKMVDTLQ